MVERGNNMESVASEEQAKQFIERNKGIANNEASACGDGRFTPDQSNGYVRLFGGDEGILMVLRGAANKLGIEISNAELVARLGASLRDIRSKDAPIGIHTDEHSLHEEKIGCGHVARAISGEAKHENLTPEDVRALRVELPEEALENQEVLEGDHQEKAVLLVHGLDWSVNSQDAETGEMYFVVDVDRATDLIDKVVDGVGISGLTKEEARHQFESQMMATAKVLAHGKDIYGVNFDEDGNFTLKKEGVVPSNQ